MEATQEATGTRLKIMELAQDLLRQRGYNGFSYGHIAEALGVKNAAIHYHFPSKQELGVALVARERRRFQIWIERRQILALDAAARLDWFFSIYQHYSEGGTRVCFLGALESSFGDLPASIQQESAALNREMLDWLGAELDAGRQSGAFHFAGEPANKAILIMGALQGAIQMARLGRPGQLDAVIAQIKADLQPVN
jgi:AcrR family transcriptional regulator